MIFKQHHKEFAIKAFAQFMTCKQVVEAFIQDFPNDLPKPPKPQQVQITQEMREEYNKERDDHIDNFLHTKVYNEYKEEFGEKADEQFEEDSPKLREQLIESYEQKFPLDTKSLQAESNAEYEWQLKDYHKQLKIDLSNQLRRFNITHPTFPKKYRGLFDRYRQEYYQNFYLNETNKTADILNKELTTLYGLAKEKAFLKQDSKNFTRHLDIAHSLLKTIVAYNTITQPHNQGAIETENPEPPKQLTE